MSLVIGLGGNVGTDAEIIERFRRAREALGATRSASLYRTAPIGPAQPAFLNTAIALPSDDWQPRELMALIRAVEHQLGRHRAREVRWGPRPIDLDVLVWDDREIHDESLDVPHPRLRERRFVLEPLAELVDDPRIAAWLAAVADQDVERIAATW